MLVLLAACTPRGPILELGPVESCTDPQDTLRFTEQALERGVDHQRGDLAGILAFGVDGTQVVARDLDGDGDVDLALGRPRGTPTLYENDGTGHFQALDPGPDRYATYRQHVANHLAADLDGDGLPELLLLSPGLLRVQDNLGAMQFSEPRVAIQLSIEPPPIWLTASVGDADGDGDIDVFLPGLDPVGATEDLRQGTWDRLYLQEQGTFSLAAELAPGADTGFSLASLFTDPDGDGDLDLLVASDRAPFGMPATAFYENPGWSNRAASWGANLALSGMGFTVHDNNGDEAWDYCITDIGGVRCLASSQVGYFESAAVMGLRPHPEATVAGWYLWSMEMEDFDHDGWLDAFAASGLPLDPGTELARRFPQPDVFWRGGPDGFAEATGIHGLDSLEHHIGAAAADLDGDGSLELVVAGIEDRTRIYGAGCTGGAWLDVDVGEAWGARIEVEADGQRRSREIQGLRSLGQAPVAAHFGLGAAATATVRVRFLDGELVEVPDIETRRRVVIRRPEP